MGRRGAKSLPLNFHLREVGEGVRRLVGATGLGAHLSVAVDVSRHQRAFTSLAEYSRDMRIHETKTKHNDTYTLIGILKHDNAIAFWLVNRETREKRLPSSPIQSDSCRRLIEGSTSFQCQSVIELKTFRPMNMGQKEVYCASTHSSVERRERSRRMLSMKACISPMRPPISNEKYTIARWMATSRAENILE